MISTPESKETFHFFYLKKGHLLNYVTWAPEPYSCQTYFTAHIPLKTTDAEMTAFHAWQPNMSSPGQINADWAACKPFTVKRDMQFHMLKYPE